MPVYKLISDGGVDVVEYVDSALTVERLEPDDDPNALVDMLAQTVRIDIAFPKYTDGRGYSHAQILRRRHQFEGDIRAVGHVLRDQLRFMARSGFTSFETAHEVTLDEVREALAELSTITQPDALAHESHAFARRHESA